MLSIPLAAASLWMPCSDRAHAAEAKLPAAALSVPEADTESTRKAVANTPGCESGFVASDDLDHADAAPLPSDGGVVYSAADLKRWKARISAGPFIRANDYTKGSPGDWSRIKANAKRFIADGEPPLELNADGNARTRHGTLARDAAFYYLLTEDRDALSAVERYLADQIAAPSNDFSRLCYRTASGASRDAWFFEAGWFLRVLVTYDFTRRSIPSAQRVLIDNWIRRTAYYFATQIDWGNAHAFPNRLRGDYKTKGNAPNAQPWTSVRADTNGDCKVDGRDDPAEKPVYAYVMADGTLGPRLSTLSQWFNNRRSVTAMAFGVAGLTLGDKTLVARSKRYFMEWLTYSVWPDGSQGEYLRNGDYCVPKQGVIYGNLNIQSALMIARLLAKAGDGSLLTFETRAGAFGTEVPPGMSAKSLASVTSAAVELTGGKLPWYQYEPGSTVQHPRPETFLGRSDTRFNATGKDMDSYHELGLLLSAQILPTVPIEELVMRKGRFAALGFPGSSGHPVITGWGEWTDPFNAMPAVLLLAAPAGDNNSSR